MDRKYYVYWYRAEREGYVFYCGKKIKIKKNQVYYVGKGTGNRAFSKDRNVETNLLIRLFGCKVEIVKDGLTNQEALDVEMSVIGYFGSEGIPLTNRTLYKNSKLMDYFGSWDAYFNWMYDNYGNFFEEIKEE
ncbi:hypothetical protein [Cytobacillus oceanisediminis]|uniref:hypothetical protein n=1 Tax=Cytobacillus oceanisediminis TaxID=665099 RepID=UPI001FB355CB|nr:hypothetical protein [Cytobacillus oceanisediminis]UOE58037.1 hypothetical protein IRB79_27625 [Cytobacillus oceanisediminis]